MKNFSVDSPASNVIEVELPYKEAGSVSLFFSYRTLVVVRIPGRGWFRTADKHSATTTRQINKIVEGFASDVKAVPQAELETLVTVEAK